MLCMCKSTLLVVSCFYCRSAPASPAPIILHPAMYAPDASGNVAPVSVMTCNASAPTNTTTPSVVTVATVNSIAEAVTMQLKKSHVLDLSSMRTIQSAPGSPQGG